jgi:hypothetical protein
LVRMRRGGGMQKIFDKNRLFPSSFAERLSFGLPGDHSYRYD